MASFYKRKLKSGEVWYASIRLANGRWKSINTKCETKAAAREVAASIERRVLLGEDPFRKGAAGGSLHLSEVVPEYLKARRDAWGVRTSPMHEHTLKLLKQALGDFPVTRITDAEVKRFTEAIRPGRSAATVNIDLRNLAAFLKWCKEIYRPHDWAVPRVRQLRAPERAHRDFYTPTEAEALVRAAADLDINGEPFGHYVAVLLLTGLRMREALTLKWNQIDLATGLIMLSNTKSRRPEMIPVTRELRELFAQWPPRLQTGTLFGFSPWSGYIYSQWNRAVEAAGIRRLKLHNCRDSFAVNLLLEGVPLAVVSRLLRHSSVVVTMQNYAGFSAEDIGRILENEKPRQDRGSYFSAILRGLHK